MGRLTPALPLLLAPLVACCSGDSPTAPGRDCAAEASCYVAAPAPLSAEAERALLAQARADAERALGRRVNAPEPRVKYVACPFFVQRSNFGAVCAAGVTHWQEGYIQVMTYDRNRLEALVWWEARNYYWCQAGECWRAI